MSFLSKGKKDDLIELADELGEEISHLNKVAELRKIILESKYYNEDEARISLQRIMEDRVKQEEERIRQEEREYALEMKRLEMNASSSGHLTSGTGSAPKIQLIQITPKFDEKKDEMGLYLINFERRAEMAQVPKENWVAYLLSVLPPEISNMMAREPAEIAKSYDHVKELILRRYKLNSEKLRQLFYQHKRNPEISWRNYAHEVRSYFEEWINDLEVKTFDQIKDLIVTEQIKRNVPFTIKDHLLDKWMKLNNPIELAAEIDRYENLRESFSKKDFNKIKKPFESRWQPKHYNGYKIREASKDSNQRNSVRQENLRTKSPENNSEKEFEKRRQLRCYECGSCNHLRPQCPKIKKRQETVASNEIAETNFDDLMAPYTSLGKVNGIRMPILRDTGATLDLICRKYVKNYMYTGECVWLRTPLEDTCICLPLAEVELECDLGHVVTKAAVLRDSLDQRRYLLGNKTAKLLEQTKNVKEIQSHMINAVMTRAQKNRLDHKTEGKGFEEIKSSEDTDGTTSENRDTILPPNEVENLETDLLKTSPENFKEEQRNSEDLKPLFELAERPSIKNKYVISNKMLFYKRFDKNGSERKLLIVPEKFREQLKKICHESATAHLGATKSKDSLVKSFYWPNCYRDIEEYVKSCDHCQRIGKPNDKKKAPLKLVPVVQEIFTKINVDTCGPLPITPTGKKYLVTAMCMSSKYADAIPVVDISSPTIIDALLQVFSRMGFPRELQCDQGTSFKSMLTTEFLEKFGIRMVHSSVRHPQSNPVERFHRTLKRILRVLCLESGPNWEQHLPHALFALRTVVHDSTGFSPAELVHGRNLRTPITILFENLTEANHEESPVINYVFNLINRMKKCQELAIEHMEVSKNKQKLWYDRKATTRIFKEGDLVLVIAPSRPNKLSVQWIGPGRIEKQLSETNYVINFPEKGKTQVFHVNMIKPYFRRPENVNMLSHMEKQMKEYYMNNARLMKT